MKTKLIFALTLSACAFLPQVAAAADGTIQFNGRITAQTCTINGGSGRDFTVTLPTVSASSLSAADATAGNTRFQIALTNCTPQAGNVRAFFEHVAGTNPSGDLNIATGNGNAANVRIRLLNANGSRIVVGAPEPLQNSQSTALSEGAATLVYAAQYVATGQATAGAATASVQYTIAYQ
ncbi:fimbrial protein [Achromobacter xylosoxidans]|jgi:major type 1 subunit fimbrin (pilin)